uniref:MHC class I-like antigen recognition-like domain-containing protein n=1 Tax=Cyprinus carpio TaxID=7962 RepID=A0A8C1KT88_CYPCA
MKFIIFFIHVPFVYSEFHTYITSYTGINGHTIPEFSAVTTLDGRQIDYYDSEIKKLIPRQDWMKEFASTDIYMWKEDTEIRVRVQQIYKNNIHVLIQRFNQSHGVHTYQRMYGCGWDDETGASEGFDQHGYDGEDYVALDVKQLRYITPVQQGVITMNKWNNDTAQLEFLKQYYQHECVNWLKHFLPLRKVDLERRGTPEVSLLQKYPSSPVECHGTGFYPSEEHHEDLDFGELLPNEDGTFQKTSTIIIGPDEWEKNQFSRYKSEQKCFTLLDTEALNFGLSKWETLGLYSDSLLNCCKLYILITEHIIQPLFCY